MGLRFRKTISLLPGVRLNVSKSGIGVSAGIPGLRGSINTSGRVTGTASIPGTGVSYVKTKKIFGNKKKDTKETKTTKAKTETKSKAKTKAEKAVEEEVKTNSKVKTAAKVAKLCIDASTLKTRGLRSAQMGVFLFSRSRCARRRYRHLPQADKRGQSA